MPLRSHLSFLGLALLALPHAAPGQAGATGKPPVVPGSKSTAHQPALTPGEARATAAFNAAKALGAPELYAFLRPFPKGGDLHFHLSGAVYAETFITEAVQQGMCVAPPSPACSVNTPAESKATQTPPSDTGTSANNGCPTAVLDPKLPALPLSLTQPLSGKSCAFGQVPAAEAIKSQTLYDALVDSFSMRGYVPQEGITGHDQFFATFARFGGLKSFTGEWLDEVARRAAAQNEQYLEIMNTPSFSHAAALGYKLGWAPDLNYRDDPSSFGSLRDKLLQSGLRDEVAIDRKEFEDAENRRRQMEGCSTEQASASVVRRNGNKSSPCDVQIRFLYQILRAFPPQQVFAQTLLAFEVAQAELDSGHPLVVGLNFVQPEDAHLAMQGYHLQMLMLNYLHAIYPKVRISLHAGELAFGMVPPDGLRFHIREAVELGHAERIGHGMDVLYEDDPKSLLKQMAERHIMVEVNLTSNDVILGRTRTDHPLAAYRAAHVPVALSTDDEGVSRIDLTHEYVKAAEEQSLTYADLKRSARTSLEHSFLPGASLWAAPDDFAHRVAACGAPITPEAQPAGTCVAFLKANGRAQAQWELERRLASFEQAAAE